MNKKGVPTEKLVTILIAVVVIVILLILFGNVVIKKLATSIIQ